MKSHQSNEIDAHEAFELIERGEAVLVDVREADEHARERIDGAQLVPMSRFDPEAIRCERGQTVILYCRSGRRSLDALRAVRAHDDDLEAVSMAGGIIGWKKCGKGVV